jgi:integrase
LRSSNTSRDVPREQVLDGWQRIAEGLIRLKATSRQVRLVRSILSSSLAPAADILGVHTCAHANGVVPSKKRENKNKLDQVGHLHLRGRTPVWYVNYTVQTISASGKIERKRVRTRIGPASEFTEQQARARKIEILAQAGVGLVAPATVAPPTVSEFVSRLFLPEHVSLLKRAGQLHYQNHLKNHVIPSIGTLKLKDVTHQDIQRLLFQKQQAKPKLTRTKEEVPARLSSQTLRHIRNVCSAIFKLAMIHGLHPGPNPAKYVKLPEMKRQPKRALTLDECRTLLPALVSPVKEMAMLSVLTSMNFAEMAGLTWARINLTEEHMTTDGGNLPPLSLIILQNHYAGEYGSVKAAARERIVPLPVALVNALRGIQSAGGFTRPNDPVFANNAGRPQTIANLNKRILKPIAERLGMGWVSWHSFRRTHATLLDMTDVPIADRVAQTGHSGFAQSLRYTSSDVFRRRGIIERVSEMVQEVPAENQARTKSKASEEGGDAERPVNKGVLGWLPDMDSNHDSRLQRPLSYR